jgi:nicotinamidase-related amidase
MTKDLGVWTAEDCALVLIDYQNEMFEVIRSETPADLVVELHVRLLAKTARAFGMPIVLSTVGVEYGFNGPTLPSILSELDGIEPLDRSSMNAFEDQPFRQAVQATGRKRLIIGGLHTEICLTFATVQALKDGYDVLYVTDAVGGRSQTAHRTGIKRLAHAGAVPTTALAVVTELFPRLGGTARRAGPRRHLLVLHRGSEAHRSGGRRGGREARRVSSGRTLRCPAGWQEKSASSRAPAGAWDAPPP